MTQMSENVRAFLAMRDAWTKEVGKNQFSKAVRTINAAYLFRRNNFNYGDWQQLLEVTKSPLYEQQFKGITGRTKAKILNTSLDVLSWFIVHEELSIAGSNPECECDGQKLTKRLSNIRKDMFDKADWKKLINTGGNSFTRDFLIKEMYSVFPMEHIAIDKQWRDQHKKILAKVAKYVRTGEPVSGLDLLTAIDAGIDVNILKYLIHNCEDIHYRDKNGQNALHHCVLHNVDLDLLNELLLYGVDSAAQDKNLMDARDYLDPEIWGEDCGQASMMLRPVWTYFYDE